MGRLLSKTSSSKKIIALLLALLLVVTPLVSYLGRGSKAEGSAVQGIELSSETAAVTLKKEAEVTEEPSEEEETKYVYSLEASAVSEKKIVIPDFTSEGQLFTCLVFIYRSWHIDKVRVIVYQLLLNSFFGNHGKKLAKLRFREVEFNEVRFS